MRRLYASVAFLIPLTVGATAFADDDDKKSNCPPGSWFCESVTVEITDDEDEDAPAVDKKAAKKKVKADDDLATSPDEVPSVADGAPVKKVRKKRRVEVEADDHDMEADAGDTVVIVKKRKRVRRGERVVVARDAEAKAILRKKKQRRWRERFGLNLRVEGAAFAGRYGETVGMGGAGASFRWRPSPYFAFDIGADIIGGSDYNGDERVEFSGALSGLVYFNPQHRVQVYGIGGVHLSHAEVDTPGYLTASDYDHYWGGYHSSTRNYFGAHGGLGLEFRISRHFAMFGDALAIIRTRIDSDVPEYYDPNTGQTSNTSGAGLFRTGVTFWW